MMRAFQNLRGRFCANARGVSAVEFALILPILILLFLGCVEFSQAISVDRKLTSAASAVGDLVAQSDELSSGEVNDFISAASAILAPFRTDDFSIVVSSVLITEDGAEVDWSVGSNTACHAPGTAMTVPPGVAQAGDSVIVTHAEYAYRPIFGQIISETIGLSETFYFRPRTVNKVDGPTQCEA